MKIYKHNGKITHITFSIGEAWISFDKTGLMGWTGKRNFYFLLKDKRFYFSTL